MGRPHVARQAAGLRVYLGYAPGVGKTYAMLHEGHRVRARGSDVVIGWVNTYNRPHTDAAVGDLEIVPSRSIEYRGRFLNEMDIDAVIARQPQVALIDELAHNNVPGSKHLKRYQDVLDLREYGINVISTINIQHLASLQDTVQMLTGAQVTETLPDWVLESADELEMVDVTPEALRKRLLRGNVQPREQVERALTGPFRLGTLSALRELTLRRVAHRAERKVEQSSIADGLPIGLSHADTVLVCVMRGDDAHVLVQRGAHLADRLHGRLVVVHITVPAGTVQPAAPGYQETVRALQLARALGAEVYTLVTHSSASGTLVQFAKQLRASQIVLGESRPSWLSGLTGDSRLRDVLRRTSDVDVHLIRRTGR